MTKDNETMHGVFVGTIVSDKMNKSRVIEMNHKKIHPKYHKTYTVTHKFVAHDENNEYKVGDKVQFRACKPYSKTKKFEIIGRA